MAKEEEDEEGASEDVRDEEESFRSPIESKFFASHGWDHGRMVEDFSNTST